MPCESCSQSFTVFNRKKKCSECRRYFCSACLFKKNSKLLCQKCLIFLRRPISKIDLNSLKIKDLIFYLQSKHISTTGCVEKEELINLVIAHSNSNNNNSSNQSNSDHTTTPNSEFDYTNSFEQIKQTCQNLFTSFTDKISSDFQKHACFTNTPPNGQQQAQRQNVTTEQPRCSPEQQPYASTPPGFSNIQIPNSTSNNNSFSSDIENVHSGNSKKNLKNLNLNSNGSSETTSPVISSPANNSHLQSSCASSAKISLSNIPEIDDGCECSDEEGDKKTILDNKPGPSGCAPANSQPNKINNANGNDNNNQTSRVSTESSSFEELGAIGGNSSGVGESSENWQFIEKTSSNGVTVGSNQESSSREATTSTTNHNMCQSMLEQDSVQNADLLRRVTRRRSDSSIFIKKSVPSPTSRLEENALLEGNEAKKLKASCRKCGKQKNRIKQEIQKFREQLEQSQQSEAEKNAQLIKFLADLEKHSRQSTEVTDSEESQASQATRMNVDSNTNVPTSASNFDIDEDIFDDINDGIHVYGTNEDQSVAAAVASAAKRFAQLEDIGSSDDLENLSVKQLKEILMLNRVDFKGCCEKTELKERVMRLWKHHKEAPPSEALSTEETCKICMDKPIQCIFLECGHMATCINCGKVLSECPICRQYVVRVVRFFKS